jgi:hypothetical protein
MTTSLSKSRRYSASEGQPGSVVWFISFGDLLTLLLCFFLVLTPWDRLKKPPHVQSLRAVDGQSQASAGAGTTFAQDRLLRRSVIKLELPLFGDAGGLSGEGLSPAVLSEEIKRAMPSDGLVDVLVCSDIDQRASVVRYVGEAFERSFGGRVSVRFVVKRSCDVSQVLAPITKNVIGRIRIVGT